MMTQFSLTDRVMFKKEVTVGQAIRAARLNRGWTRADLAGRLECDVETLETLETTAAYPPLGLILHIAAIFDMDPSQIYGQLGTEPNEHVAIDRLYDLYCEMQQKSGP